MNKTLLTIGLSLTVGITSMMAQNETKRPFDRKNEKIELLRKSQKLNANNQSQSKSLLKADAVKQHLDSIVYFVGGKKSDKGEYIYDNNGNLKSEIWYGWSYYNDNISSNSKYEYTYDTYGKLILVVGHFESIWGVLHDSKYEYTYNTNGKLISEVGYMWKNDEWESRSKEEYTYDANGNLILRIGYINWLSLNREWDFDSKYEYTYDTKGNLISEIHSSWSSGDWKIWDKNEYTYDDSGNLILKVLYDYDRENEEFVFSSKREYTYDTNGNLISEVIRHWKNNAWEFDNKKFEYIYNTNGKIVSVVAYSWNNNEWEIIGEYENYTYDTNENRISKVEYDYTYTYVGGEEVYKREWGNKSKEKYEFDLSVLMSDVFFPYDEDFYEWCFNKPIKVTYYTWSENDWQEDGYALAYYSNIQSGSNVGIVETWRAASLPGIVGYYNLTGQKLTQEPQRGMYIIMYDNGTSKTIMKK